MHKNPKIEFHHAKLLEPYFISDTLKKQPDFVCPTQEEFDESLDKHKEEWEKIRDLFFDSIQDFFKINFKDDSLDAYVVRGARRSMSKPLVIAFAYDTDKFIYRLLHELTHILLKGQKRNKKFLKETMTTQNHIPVFAFLNEFYTKKYKKGEFLKNLKSTSQDPNYKKAWQIAEKVGQDYFNK